MLLMDPQVKHSSLMIWSENGINVGLLARPQSLLLLLLLLLLGCCFCCLSVLLSLLTSPAYATVTYG
jgi:hypothetical protein